MGFQIIEQLLPFMIILLGLVLVFVSVSGIVIYFRRAPEIDNSKNKNNKEIPWE